MQNLWKTYDDIAGTRGVQKVRRLTQLTTRYAHHILSLFNIPDSHLFAPEMQLVQHFLHCSDTVVEELLFLVFEPAISVQYEHEWRIWSVTD